MRLSLAFGLLLVAACDGSAGRPAEPPTRTSPPSTVPVVPRPDEPSASAPEPLPPSPPPPEDPSACPSPDRWPDGMVCVPGGTFELGAADGEPDDGPPGEASLDAFYLDRFEVTNEAFRACIEAEVCEPNRRYRGFRRDRQPVVAVSWYAARDFCVWRGGRLPTDAEFERAARGPEGATFPWGDAAAEPCMRAVVRDRQGEGCGTGVTAEVGSRPAGFFGVYDLAGNVHEWTADRWAPCLRGCPRACGDACFGHDPRGPCSGEEICPGHPLRSVRGGSWYWTLPHARGAARRGADPDNEAGHRFGFRCAREI